MRRFVLCKLVLPVAADAIVFKNRVFAAVVVCLVSVGAVGLIVFSSHIDDKASIQF